MLCLEDLARYVSYIIESPSSSHTNILEVATCHVTGEQIAEAFSKATGKQASYIDVPLQEYLEAQFKHHRRGVDSPIGLQTFSHIGGTSAERIFLPQTWRQNFTCWWNIWRRDFIHRDYAMLNDILPDRMKSVDEWMVETNYTGQVRPVLKSYNDHLAELKA